MCSCKPSSLPGLGDSDACQNLRTTGIVDAVDQHFKMKFHWNTHRLQSCITNRPVTSEAEHITQTCALQKNFLQKRIFLQKKKIKKKKKSVMQHVLPPASLVKRMLQLMQVVEVIVSCSN